MQPYVTDPPAENARQKDTDGERRLEFFGDGRTAART